jgi:hypothetical protein
VRTDPQAGQGKKGSMKERKEALAMKCEVEGGESEEPGRLVVPGVRNYEKCNNVLIFSCSPNIENGAKDSDDNGRRKDD